MKKIVFFLLTMLPAFIAVAEDQSGQELAPMVSEDFDRFYLASSFKLPVVNEVFVEDVEVEFSRAWLKDFRSSTSSSYQKRIKRKYGKAMKTQLIDALEAAGWSVKTEKSMRTIVLSPKIVELNIFAPNEPGIRQVIVRNAGYAQLELTFLTPRGQPFMKIEDRRLTRESIGSPIVANMASNYRYFKMLMDKWAKKSTVYLDSVVDLVKEQAKGQQQ